MSRRLVVGVALLAILNVALNACESGDEKAKPGSGGSPTPTSGAGADPESVFKPLSGYDYMDVPESTQAQARAQFERDPRSKQSIRGIAMRSVTQNGEPAAFVMVLSLDPRAAAAPGFRKGEVEGFEKRAGSSAEPRTLAGEEVLFVRAPEEGVEIFVWQPASLTIFASGLDGATVEEILTALIRANT